MHKQAEPPLQVRTARLSRLNCLVLALLITAASVAIPSWDLPWYLYRDWELVLYVGESNYYHFLMLLVGLALALSSPRQSGLRIFGDVRAHAWGVAVVTALPILATALLYPQLADRPFADASWGMWGISPLAQDLIFIGFIYGMIDAAFPGRTHARIPVDKAVLLTAGFFALWHVQNFFTSMSAGYVCFQLVYTSLGYVLAGLSRQWTGSILYAVVAHTGVNAIAFFAK